MEIWKAIEGYPDYQVSNLGRVKSLKFNREIILKPRIKNYAYVSLSFNSLCNNFYIHRLVAIAFIPNPENKLEVNHIDGNKYNNSVSNLEWNTSKENKSHAKTIGLYNQKGCNSVNSKVTEKDVLEIRNSNLSYVKLSKIYKISPSSIFNIKNKKTWTNI